MPMRNRFAWSNQSCEEQLQMAYSSSREDLRMMARAFDWSTDHEAVLSWIMAHKYMDLASALTVFFNGDPARFNYMPRRHIPEEFLAQTSLLDNICLRINSGFYRKSNTARVENRDRLERWLHFQSADRKEGRRGRWILDEAIIERALAPAEVAFHMQESQSPSPQYPFAAEQDPGSIKTAFRRCVAGLISEISQKRRAG
ncbi:MAG: hypothetical protein AAFQ28_11030 [Pseudomonadota bacterium]